MTGHRSSAWGARERGPSSAHTGLLSRASSSENPRFAGHRSCSTSGRRHPAKLRHSQCSFYAVFIVGFTLGILGAALAQPPDQRIARILGRAFRSRPLPENASHSEAEIWDALSAKGKARPIPSITSERAWLSPLAHLGKRDQLDVSPAIRGIPTSLRKAAF